MKAEILKYRLKFGILTAISITCLVFIASAVWFIYACYFLQRSNCDL
jgi:hypothetical protein